jgi:hypothetical protein
MSPGLGALRLDGGTEGVVCCVTQEQVGRTWEVGGKELTQRTRFPFEVSSRRGWWTVGDESQRLDEWTCNESP